MTPKISLITAVAGAALVLAVPAAWGDNWAADRQQQREQASMLDARERALGVSQGNGRVSASEARERSFGTKLQARLSSETSSDVVGRAVDARGTSPDPVRDDRFRLDATTGSEPITISSGSEIEWPQIGIGFGVGIVLMLGLYFALRGTRNRPLAN
jgi:hypothetical protein